MSKVAVVYWSGTGNTAAMAEAVADGARGKGADVDLLTVAEFDTSSAGSYDALAFGCPAMGAEVLEESEFEPMFSSVEGSLNGKNVGLFGSWGWGNGAWMNDWELRCSADGMNVVGTVTCMEAPDDSARSECKALGESLA